MTSLIEKPEPHFNSLHDFYLNAAHKIHSPQSAVMFYKEKGKREQLTYQDILDGVAQVGAYFMELGLEKGDRVALMMDNCPEYYVIDQTIQKLGLVNVSVYPTLTGEETAYILNDSGSKVLFVGSAFLFKKFKKVEEECASVIKVITMQKDLGEGEKFSDYTTVLVEGEGLKGKHESAVAERFASVVKTDLSTFIYTSGTRSEEHTSELQSH